MNTDELCKHGMQIASCADCRRSIEPDSIRFTKDELEKAARFAQEAPTRDSQPIISRVSTSYKDIDSFRIHKLGQIAFAKFLILKGKTHSAMKDVLSEWTDFETADCKKLYIHATRYEFPGCISIRPEKVHDNGLWFYVSVYVVEAENKAYIKGFATTDEMQESGIVVKETRSGHPFTIRKQYRVYEREWARLNSISVLLSKSSYFRLKWKNLYSPDDNWF